jgi:hypothetical protein
MRINQPAEGLEAFFGAVESLQGIVQRATTPQEIAAKAQQIGFDPELVDEMMRRLRAVEKRNFVQSRVTTKEIATALLGILIETDTAAPQAGITRQALRAIGQRTAKAFNDLHDAVTELGGFAGPSLRQVGTALVETHDAAVAAAVENR